MANGPARDGAPVIDRRESLAALGAALLLGSHAGAARPVSRGEPFSWDRLRALGMRVARAPWRSPPHVAEAHGVDYDAVGQIAYREDKTLWGEHGDAFGVRFFPVNKAAPAPVDIFVVEGGRARRFLFSPDLFTLTQDKAGKAPKLLPGFGGMRVMNPGGLGDWLAFQGASYFRSAGALDQYGLSARGLAVNTGIDGQEEFPIFTRFWLERGPGAAITIYALMEGRSVAGVWRFVNRHMKAGVTQDVSCDLWLRRDVARLGFAPLTSMFWYGEGNRRQGIDWRPEIHDSDGLALWTGAGERLWRPLANPSSPITNSFADRAPRGFGLFQRDRHFDHYQDDGAFYDKRPNLWVEPQGDWGEGAVTLYEIPTVREYEDNIVAFWTPAKAATAGSHYALDYRLRWIAGDPAPSPLAEVVDCWTGTAGPAGTDPIPGAARLVADFVGESLRGLTRTSGVEPVVSVGHARLLSAVAYPVVGMSARWRLIVDVALDHGGPADLRAYLKHDSGALSETLLYQLAKLP
jgi:glucans biosynthesis protein